MRSEKFSTNETQILISYIEKEPTNLMEAFRKTSKATGRALNNVINHYYGTLRHKQPEIVMLKTKQVHTQGKNKPVKGVSKVDTILGLVLTEYSKEDMVKFILDSLTQEQKTMILKRLINAIN